MRGNPTPRHQIDFFTVYPRSNSTTPFSASLWVDYLKSSIFMAEVFSFPELFLRCAVICCASLVLAACGPDDNGMAPNGPPPVRVATPIVEEVVEWDEYTGRFDAVEFVEVRARVSGYLKEVSFEDGQIVEKGAPLFVIDQRPFDNALKQSQAELEDAKAQVDLADKAVARGAELRRTRAISVEDQDERVATLRSAQARVQAAEAALANAELNLEFTEIKAPIAGRVSRNLVSVGNLVSGGAADATVLTTIVSIDPMHFYFEVSETAFLKYTRANAAGTRTTSRDAANPVKVRLLDETEFTREGTMDFVENRLDQSSGTLEGRAVIANPDDFLQPGQFGRIRLLGSGAYEAVLVPDDVIGTDQSRKFVYVVDEESMVERRWITLGPIINGLRVIRNGLNGDERVIIGGVQRVRAGVEVTAMADTIERLQPAAGG